MSLSNFMKTQFVAVAAAVVPMAAQADLSDPTSAASIGFQHSVNVLRQTGMEDSKPQGSVARPTTMHGLSLEQKEKVLAASNVDELKKSDFGKIYFAVPNYFDTESAFIKVKNECLKQTPETLTAKYGQYASLYPKQEQLSDMQMQCAEDALYGESHNFSNFVALGTAAVTLAGLGALTYFATRK